MLVPRRLHCRPLSFTGVAPTCPPPPPVLGHGATKSSADTRLHWGVWIYQIHCDEQHVHFHTTPLGIQVFFRLHHYLDKRSLSVTKCVSGGERGEAVGSALVPLINAFLSMYELQFGPRKCFGDWKLVQKMRQCFHFCQKKLISWWATTGYVYLQYQNKIVVSGGPSLLFSTVFQGNRQDNISYGKSINDFKLSSLFLKAESVLQICFEDLLLLNPTCILQSHRSVSS